MSSNFDIIHSWLLDLFKTIETGESSEIENFTFGPLHQTHTRNCPNKTEKSLAVLREVSVDLRVLGECKTYNLVVKVLPSSDDGRGRPRVTEDFQKLLKFSKEVQVYLDIGQPIGRVCDQLGLVSPLSKAYLGQIDGLNDCLVLDNINKTGYVKCDTSLTQKDNLVSLHKHCNVVLQNIAKFHALSRLLAKISREDLSDIFPFAVEAESFRQLYLGRVLPVSERLAEYLRWDLRADQIKQILQEKIEKLFWKLLEIKAKPSDPFKEVLIHGNLNFHNIMFRYEAGEPVDCRFLDLSDVNVSNSVIDIIIFLFTVQQGHHINSSYLSYLLTYHSHLTQFCRQMNVSEFLSLEELVEDYRNKKFFGTILHCKVQMGSYLLLAGERIEISPEKSDLFLKYLEDCCDCTEHRTLGDRNPGISCHANSTTSPTHKSISTKIAAFIKQTAISQTVRDI